MIVGKRILAVVAGRIQRQTKLHGGSFGVEMADG
jgi:hypothetical protein